MLPPGFCPAFRADTGPFYLRQPAVADLVVEAIEYNAGILRHYVLHAFVVMPNHVHLLITPAVALPKLTKSLKGITAKRANAILALTGRPFWQEESYDHVVRHEQEVERRMGETVGLAGRTPSSAAGPLAGPFVAATLEADQGVGLRARGPAPQSSLAATKSRGAGPRPG